MKILSSLTNNLFERAGRNIIQNSKITVGKHSRLFQPIRVDGGNHISIGQYTSIQANSWLYCEANESNQIMIEIGNHAVLGYNTHISCMNRINIEDHVLTANNVFIGDNIHEYSNPRVPIKNQGLRFIKEVNIGSGTWIGENVVVIGANIGKNCVIGANSVVTRDIPDHSVAIGAPARVIKSYDINREIWVNVDTDE